MSLWQQAWLMSNCNENAAREPEVIDLANCLKLWAQTYRAILIITIEEWKIDGASFSVMPDRVEVGTYLTAVAMTEAG